MMKLRTLGHPERRAGIVPVPPTRSEHDEGARKMGGGTGVLAVTVMDRVAMPQSSALKKVAGFHDISETKGVSSEKSRHFRNFILFK